jgi:hypothetical protein
MRLINHIICVRNPYGKPPPISEQLKNFNVYALCLMGETTLRRVMHFICSLLMCAKYLARKHNYDLSPVHVVLLRLGTHKNTPIISTQIPFKLLLDILFTQIWLTFEPEVTHKEALYNWCTNLADQLENFVYATVAEHKSQQPRYTVPRLYKRKCLPRRKREHLLRH